MLYVLTFKNGKGSFKNGKWFLKNGKGSFKNTVFHRQDRTYYGFVTPDKQHKLKTKNSSKETIFSLLL